MATGDDVAERSTSSSSDESSDEGDDVAERSTSSSSDESSDENEEWKVNFYFLIIDLQGSGTLI